MVDGADEVVDVRVRGQGLDQRAAAGADPLALEADDDVQPVGVLEPQPARFGEVGLVPGHEDG